MKILLAHVVHSPSVNLWYQEIAASAGDDLEVSCFCMTIDPPSPRLAWKELDQRWRAREKKLMALYSRLQQAADSCDVLLLYNGVNLHPEFLPYLSTFNVYSCFDDPESSENLSAPVAAAFDAVFYGNIAARFQYESWGCKRLAWLPVFTAPSDVPSQNEEHKISYKERNVDISLVCARNSQRKARLDRLVAAFPHAKCYGSGWNAGRIDDVTLKQIYEETKIGWNIHNSTGPINRRMFALSGFGILQICDNKTGLAHIFELGKEIVGFNTIPEAIELTRYYLAHADEGQEIAINGWHRFWKDYHAGAIWQRIGNQLSLWMDEGNVARDEKRRPFPAKTPAALVAPISNLARGAAGKFVMKGQMFVEAWRKSKPCATSAFDDRVYIEEKVRPYQENPEMKGVNMAKERLATGQPFEWPNMLALNWAATSLIRDAKSIVEIGSGTGPFAHFAAVDRSRTIHCFEEDDFARSWAEEHRSYPNVTYFKHFEGHIVKKYDLLISLDVFEHVDNMREFLSFCSSLAPIAIYSTPNREVVRPSGDKGPPAYMPHVREFSPGELYWILRQYYREVSLYHMPNVYVPWIEPMTILTKGTPIIAECRGPLE
ncbi:MAG: glycosyltransferase [Desulfobacterales bacterium]|uniref:Glycosyltransferase n=1 Tax=Candidatus Desulfatibia profunda TaxID=2841695 RepID=A0A8J6NPI0_9BACT|nr:glycosyltransferase [Candidatus Desulfatibia profunda]MBL7196266.1 glycosyltransferase [Desulfobacterales bacterium]